MKAWYQTHQFVESVFFLHCSSPFLLKIRSFIALWTPEIFPILFKYSGRICDNASCPVTHFVQLSLWTPLLEHHKQSKKARGPLRVGMWLHIPQRFMREEMEFPSQSQWTRVKGQATEKAFCFTTNVDVIQDDYLWDFCEEPITLSLLPLLFGGSHSCWLHLNIMFYYVSKLNDS